jgi:two-component system chemotaxis response regulator CheB
MTQTSNLRDIVVIAASMGGLQAFKRIVSSLPADLPASVFLVMHVGAWPSQLPAILQADSALPSHMHAMARPLSNAGFTSLLLTSI